MLTRAFYYFLMIGELAILGLIIAGIYAKTKRIIQMSAVRGDDQNSEHHVSESDQSSYILHDSLSRCADGLPSQAPSTESRQAPRTPTS
jgi:hypothetical protein